MTETDVLTGGAVAEEAASTRPSRAKRRPLPARCYACHAPVTGPYCCACGQKNDDLRRSVWSLAAESVRDVVSLEGRFLRTVRAVVTRPGRYLRDYGAGVRSPYTPPIRFFLVISFAFFTTLWLADRQIVVFQPVVELNEAGELRLQDFAGGFFAHAEAVRYSAEERAAMREALAGDGSAEPDRLRDAAEAELDAMERAAEAEAAALREAGRDDAAREVLAAAREDAEEVRGDLAAAIEAAEDAIAEASGAREAGREVGRGLRDGLAGASRDEVLTEEPTVQPGPDFGPDGTIELNGRELDRDRFLDALLRVAENPRAFNNALDDWIPRIMVLMVPLMALSGALFVRGRDALLYDHALLSLNTHAVAFGLMTLGLWTSALLPGWLLAGTVLLGVPIYYARGLRGAFGRSRRKTIAATGFVFSVYGLVLAAALTAAAVGAFTDTI